jgi:non-specific serine/threonine protein kinase
LYVSDSSSAGRWLKARRKQLDLTQEALAERVGCSPDTVRKIEAGKQRPSQQLAGLLLTELGVPPDERPEALRLLRSLAAPIVPPASSPGAPSSAAVRRTPSAGAGSSGGLPLPATSLIGRDAEIGRLRELLLNPEARLVTLVGPPGIGKTRLALALTQRLRDQFAAGVFFVELAPLTDPGLVPSAIAALFGVGHRGGEDLVALLAEYLRDKQLLLVLDNFEHLLAAAPAVDLLLKQAPGLKVLATSRAPLQVYGEKEYPVPALRVPGEEPDQALEELARYDAVRLFVERARDIVPDFEITGENAPTLGAICQRLDGLPLALELAAARIRILPPAALLARLGGRLKLLTGGASTLPQRQRTLQAAIEWSHDLLSTGERQLFRRLGVFQGGATLEAITAVCGDGGDGDDVLDDVQSLVGKSLLKQRVGRSGEPRFWMLETIHEFSRAKLSAAGEDAALARRHAGYFLCLAEEAHPNVTHEQRFAWVARMDDEHDNIRAALGWSLEAATPHQPEILEIGLRIGRAVHWFWNMRGYVSEDRSWLSRLLDRYDQVSTPDPLWQRRSLQEVRLAVLSNAGFAARHQGDDAAGRAFDEQRILLAQELGDKPSAVEALAARARIRAYEGDYDTAIALHMEASALARELGKRDWLSVIICTIGVWTHRQGDYAAARAYYQQALEIDIEMGDLDDAALQLENLGMAAYDQGDYSAANRFLAEALQLADLEQRSLLADILVIMAAVEARRALAAPSGGDDRPRLPATPVPSDAATHAGQLNHGRRAARLLGAGEALLRRMGDTLAGLAIEQRIYGEALAGSRSLLGEEQFEALRREGQQLADEQALAYARECLST